MSEMATVMDTDTEVFGEVISSYSRKQAIEDGILVDVSEVAREAGLKFPVALTRAVYEDCVAWTEEDSKRQTYQDLSGRLWDVVYMLRCAARNGGSEMHYSLYRVPKGGKGKKARLVTLKAVCGPSDDMSPCITVMQIDED